MNTTEKNTEVVADELSTKKNDYMLVNPVNIVLAGDNIREDMGDLEELANSIGEIGIQIPLKGKKVRGEDKFVLVDGHRRFAAIQILIERGVDVGRIPLLPFNGSDEDRLITMMATGIGQKELTPVEQAEGVKKLLMMHYSVEEIARKIGKSSGYIRRLGKLSEAPREIKRLLAQGKVSSNVVVDIMKETDNAQEQTAMVNDVIKTATENGRKKATHKDTKGTKVGKETDKNKIAPFHLISMLVDRIEEEEDEDINDNMRLFLKVYTEVKKSKSVEELFKLFK